MAESTRKRTASSILVTLLLAVISAEANNVVRNHNAITGHSFILKTQLQQQQQQHRDDVLLKLCRGGAIDSDDEYDSEYDDSDDEESSLSKAAIAAASKSKAKKAKAAKKAVSKSLGKASSAATKKKRSSPFKKIPYFIRAFMNPFTVFAMTRGYFASLFNIDYLQQDTSSTLRSALEEKAKKAPTSGGVRKSRKMRPGQAKTLSDLPQLSA